MVVSRIVGWFFDKVIGDPLARFEKANARPFAMQEDLLRRILRENAETEIGREFSFARIASLSGTELWKTYRKEVPLRGYSDFLPAIERMKSGGENILIPGRAEMFSVTPGTVAAPKFCPVGSAFLKDRQTQSRLWAHHVRKHHPRVRDGKYLALAAPAETGRTVGGIPYGSLSPQSQKGSVTPEAVRRLPGAEERWFHTLLFAMAEEDLRAVAAMNPDTLITLARRMDRDAGRLLDHMKNGLPSGPAGEGSAFASAFVPNPARARALREMWRADGALTPHSVWPGLEIILTSQGGAGAFHLPHVAALWGDTAMRCPGLRAAEGMFTIPLRDSDASGVLAVGGHVMEFLPEGSSLSGGDGAQTLLAGQLEQGKLYRLIVTTSGGLYRYDMGDLVRVTGFLGRTPEVRFERRADAVLSAAGEAVTEDQLVGAMAAAAAEGPLLNGFTVTYETGEAARYVIALECAGGSDLTGGRGKKLRARLEQLRSVFDFELMKNNGGYNGGRQEGRLGVPRLVLLEEGSYERGECQAKQVVMTAAGDGVFERMKIVAEV